MARKRSGSILTPLEQARGYRERERERERERDTNWQCVEWLEC